MGHTQFWILCDGSAYGGVALELLGAVSLRDSRAELGSKVEFDSWNELENDRSVQFVGRIGKRIRNAIRGANWKALFNFNSPHELETSVEFN